MFFSHYWRRQDPPVSLRGGDYFSSFLIFSLRFSEDEKFLSVFVEPLRLTQNHTQIVPLLAATGAAGVPQGARFSFGIYSKCQFFSTQFSIAENLQR